MKIKTMSHRKARRMQNARMASCLEYYNTIDLSLLAVPLDLMKFMIPSDSEIIIGSCNVQTTKNGYVNAFFHKELHKNVT